MRKVDDGEKREKRKEKKRKKIMTFIVTTNVIASRPPKRRPTGTPHACANMKVMKVKISTYEFIFMFTAGHCMQGSFHKLIC